MNRSKLASIILVVAFILISVVTPTQASTILYATGVGSGPNAGVGGLYTVNPFTGVATLDWTFPSAFIHSGGLAYDSSTDTLYATGYDNLSQPTLYSINRFTGAITTIGLTGGVARLDLGGLAIDPLTGGLYAAGTDGLQNTGLFSVDKTTGAATLIGQTGGQFTALYGLGFRNDGMLFANGFATVGGGYSTESHLLTVNLTTGAATDIGPEGVTIGRQLYYSGLAFRDDGTLLSLGSTSPSTGGLYSVDAVTGAANLLGENGIEFGVDGGLAFAPDSPASAVPEPGTLALLGTGLLGMLGAARRKWLG